MIYTLIWPNQKYIGAPPDIVEVRTWDELVLASPQTWMLGKRIGVVLRWCEQYRVKWTVRQ